MSSRPSFNIERPSHRRPTFGSARRGRCRSVAEELKRRTLTNRYNQRPTWLDLAHPTVDHAVVDVDGWPQELNDVQMLVRLLALNPECAAA